MPATLRDLLPEGGGEAAPSRLADAIGSIGRPRSLPLSEAVGAGDELAPVAGPTCGGCRWRSTGGDLARLAAMARSQT
jgi:hypothetical protein